MLTATPGLSDYEWCNFQHSQHHSFFKQNFQSLFAVKKGELGLIFFNTWFTDFFSQNIKVGGGRKMKIKITKKFFFYLI